MKACWERWLDWWDLNGTGVSVYALLAATAAFTATPIIY
jgi:hypothetical protein